MPAAECPQSVLDLVELFDRNRSNYRSGDYLERDARTEFIEPLFEALGWDVRNVDHPRAEAYKDVVQEHAIKTASGPKAPDYCFRIGGTPKFFVEAKRPTADIAEDAALAYQLRRYAWSAKLPLSILTDFEELAVYDCRTRPVQSDRASKARTMYLRYAEYPERWDELSSIFSKEAVFQGSFDRYAESTRRKRGTAEVDAAFLDEIERWRELLARNIALRNSGLSTRELNFAVARTIDRVIFLRMCEDRGVEEYGRLQALLNGTNAYGRLCELFTRADDRYNSGLFHFRVEKGRPEPPDELTPKLDIDDKTLKDILKGLYYPDSPYEFSVLPADILGQVYEQFLGKVIRLTPAHRAVVEDKPEVKKAGGVYYTPTYIVDYIVEHTVGVLLEDKTPRDVAGIGRGKRPLCVLDPACGSGSFLIGAYQRLLDWHRDRYAERLVPLIEKGKDAESREVRRLLPQRSGEKPVLPVYEGRGGEWRLTTAERKRILLTCIYGVDIDPQAVEVTKLSLLLKVLEGENRETLERQQRLFHERALPDLASNVKCGNSLIGPDFYDGRQGSLFDEEDRYRINAFDWQAEFPEVFAGKDGGFDAVIGNPPYGASVSAADIEYCRRMYQSASASCDSYALFMERASALLAQGGFLGMIVQSGWVSAPAMSHLRAVFAAAFKPLSFVTMPYDVFGAYVDTVITVAERLPNGVDVRDLDAAPVELVVFPPRFRVSGLSDFDQFLKSADARDWVRKERNEFLVATSEEESCIIARMQDAGTCFADVADIQRGVTPFKTHGDPPTTNPFPAFDGTVRRYSLQRGNPAFIRYDSSLAEFKPKRYFVGPRLLLRELISRQFRLQAVYTEEAYVTNKSMQSVLLMDEDYDILFLLGILNSKLISWYFLAIHSVGRRDDFPKIVLSQSRSLPFPRVDPAAPEFRRNHGTMVSLVGRVLDAHRSLAETNTPHEKEVIQREIEATDRQIDRVVYELYELTDEEIRIVEEATNA